jgi:hypothetical protein
LNTSLPILVTEFGSVTVVNDVQFTNAPSPILVTESGSVTDGNDVQSANAPSLILSSVEVGVNVTEFKIVQPSNAFIEMLVTIFPIVTPIKLLGGRDLLFSDGSRNKERNEDGTIGVEVISAV